MSYFLDKTQSHRLAFPVLMALCLIGLFWGISFWELHFEWQVNEQYNYGFFIPFLTLYLLYLRWHDRPSAEPNTYLPLNFILVSSAILSYGVAFLFLSNVDWRPLHFLQGFSATFVTFSLLYTMGGWPWVRHFGIPILFLWISVPWPRFLEKELINGLMDIVATFTVDILNLSGVYATQQGSAILLKTGAVNVAEACSGVRSFQSTLMGGLFLGELFRLPYLLRGLLIVLACFFAGFFNITRTLGLTWIANIAGPENLNHWHDPAGYLVFGMSFGLLFLLGLFFKKYSPSRMTIANPIGPHIPFYGSFIFYILMVAMALPFSYLWYYYRSDSVQKQPLWTIDWEKGASNVRFKPLDNAVLSVLMCDDSLKAEWESLSGGQWYAYYMAWNSPEKGQIGGLHSPGNCLPSVGWQLIAKGQPVFWTKDGVQFIICPFVFSLYDKKIFVFDVQWDPSGYAYYLTDGLRYYKDRFKDAWEGNRKNYKRTLEFIAENYATLDEATYSFLTFLDKTLRVSTLP